MKMSTFVCVSGSSAPHHFLLVVLHDHLMARLRLFLVRRRSLYNWLLSPVTVSAGTPSASNNPRGIQRDVREVGDEMTTTAGDERDVSFFQNEGLEVVALYREICGNQVDLVRAGPIQVSNGGFNDICVGFDFGVAGAACESQSGARTAETNVCESQPEVWCIVKPSST